MSRTPASQPIPASRFTEAEEEFSDGGEDRLDGTDPGARVVSRPDGWYWQSADGRQEFGPFDSADDAIRSMERDADDAIEPGETLFEAEQELGLADWIDPDTGELAEGMPTRLEDEH